MLKLGRSLVLSAILVSGPAWARATPDQSTASYVSETLRHGIWTAGSSLVQLAELSGLLILAPPVYLAYKAPGYLYGSSSATKRPVGATRTGIVLIHGTDAGCWQWAIAVEYLRNLTDREILCVEYQSRQPVVRSTTDVVAQIDQVFGENDEISLIGTSQGGVIALKAVLDQRLQPKAKVSMVTAICGPVQGTPRADLVVDLGLAPKTGAVADMRTTSLFTKTLNNQIKIQSHSQAIDWHFVTGAIDFIVPPEYALPRPDAGMRFSTYDSWLGHLTPLVNPAVWGYLAKHL